MYDLLTARQVQEILKVDRITVYRMLNDGRIKGVKVGQQWRFTRQEVERLLSNQPPAMEPIPSNGDPTFPTHCVQTIQDLFSEVSQTSALVVDNQGAPVTEISQPCGFCRLILSSPSGRKACQESWRAFVSQPENRPFTCHAGLQYTGKTVQDQGRPAGHFLAGQFYWQQPDPREEAYRIQKLAETHGISEASLQETARHIPVIEPAQHNLAENWPATAARAVESILQERTGFLTRLQKIANLTQIS